MTCETMRTKELEDDWRAAVTVRSNGTYGVSQGASQAGQDEGSSSAKQASQMDVAMTVEERRDYGTGAAKGLVDLKKTEWSRRDNHKNLVGKT